jgi:hypothetical protein
MTYTELGILQILLVLGILALGFVKIKYTGVLIGFIVLNGALLATTILLEQRIWLTIVCGITEIGSLYLLYRWLTFKPGKKIGEEK